MKVKDILQIKGNDIWSISPSETAYKALELMAQKDIGALLIIDGGKLAGIFSERDYARKVILKGKSSKETMISELMTREVYAIESDKSVEECLALMTAAHCRHVPVFEDNRLIGMVTARDMANAIISQQKITIDDLTRYISGSEYIKISDNP